MGPDFICIGAPKAGTGWLFDQLSWHPQIWMPPAKELRYLGSYLPEKRPGLRRLQKRLIDGRANRINRKRAQQHLRPVDERDVDFISQYLDVKRRNLDNYARLFAMKGAQLSGDITPLYSALEPRQISALINKFPKLKVIYLIREPVSRAWSHIQMHMRQSERPNRKIQFDIENLDEVRKFITSPRMDLRSRPTRVLDRWQSALPQEQFFYAFFDDICQQPTAVLQNILRFLEVSPEITGDMLPPDFNRKDSKEKYVMTSEISDYLNDFFRDEIDACIERFGDQVLSWSPDLS